MLMLSKRFSHQPLALLPHLRFAGAAHLGREAPQQAILDIRMKLGLKVAPEYVLTSDDQAIECLSFQSQFEQLRDVFEMMQYFVIDAAFGVTRVVACKSVATTPARQRPEESLLLFYLVEMQIKEAGPVPIHKGHP